MRTVGRPHGVCVGIFAALLVLLPAAGGGALAGEPSGEDGASEELERLRALDKKLRSAMEERDFERARSIAESIVEQRDDDPTILYDYARTLSMTDKAEKGAEVLIDAISHGFTDLHRMDRDPLLEAARETDTYDKILLGWRGMLDQRGDANLEQMKDIFGEYTFRTDDELRLHYACALSDESFEQAREQIGLVTDWAYGSGLLRRPEPDSDKPHAWVGVLIPTQEDFYRVTKILRVGGYYNQRDKRLVTRDIGSSLRHESFHVFHYRHMSELGQEHAYWIAEGLASLLEDVETADTEGGLRPTPSWRTNIARNLGRGNSFVPMKRFSAMDREEIVGGRARALYAQARAFMMFLLDRGVLVEWYSAYTESFDEDPTGFEAIKSTLDMDENEIDMAFRQWARELPEVADSNDPADASLGFTLGGGAVDGIRIARSVSGSRTEGDVRIRRNDVLLRIGDEPVPTMDEMHKVLGRHDVGERVRLTLRSGDERYEATVELVEHDYFPGLD